MNKRATRKRTLVLLLTLTMILGCLNIGGYSKTSGIVDAEELATGTDSAISVTAESGGEDFEYENTYNSENFDVNFKLDSVWDTGYNATITITNTSDSVIENWCLTFPLNETISNIWNVREVAEDLRKYKEKGREKYVNNAAISSEITEVELDILIDYHKDFNYYNLVYHNCSIVAIRAWNVVSEDVCFDKTIFPRELKKNIEKNERILLG